MEAKTADKAATATLVIPLNMTLDDILAAMEDLCGRMADTGAVEECWKIRETIDDQFSAA